MAKVLLVIGNGFDMKCGLKSSFPQYLSSDFYAPVIERIRSLDEKLSEDLNYPSDYDGYRVYDKYKISFSDLLFWDLYFGLPHYYEFPNIEEWYSFENKLKEFVNSAVDDCCEYRDIMEIERQSVNADSYNNKDYKRKLILYFYLKSIISSSSGGVRNVLFEQLKMYEKRFGEYIKQIQTNEKNYISNAKDIINKMLDKSNKDEVAYINSFNYSDLTTIVKDVWHINGNVDNPIFGVDYPKAKPDDYERYRYTKTYRRLELHGNESYYPKRKDYSKIVVFGHSLNEQDYSYFYALFNNLNLGTDRSSTRKGYFVEFVYSKYGDKTSDEVRKELISRVLKLFYGYNQEILHEQNYRLIDILFSSGAIRFTEIE